MAGRNKIEVKLFFVIGVVTILSGLFLVIGGDYLIGVSGSIVGVWLATSNWKQLKSTSAE